MVRPLGNFGCAARGAIAGLYGLASAESIVLVIISFSLATASARRSKDDDYSTRPSRPSGFKGACARRHTAAPATPLGRLRYTFGALTIG